MRNEDKKQAMDISLEQMWEQTYTTLSDQTASTILKIKKGETRIKSKPWIFHSNECGSIDIYYAIKQPA
jgi:hypothetical protein